MESTVAQKLDALQKLQQIDSQLDEIMTIRGALPEEVSDLEDEITGYETRIEKYNNEVKQLENNIKEHKTAIKDAEKLIQKYKEQQMNVRNNREYDAISKELELQDLEIQISEKRIKEAHVKIDSKKEEIKSTEKLRDERAKDLKAKKDELDNIVSESQEDENKLMKSREKTSKQIEERLLRSYNKIRKNARNGLAVVSVKRGACGGCFNIVPPQRQADIRERKKLIVCEHCGRIMADVEEVVVEEKKPKRTTRKKATKKK